jgi:nitrate reductase (cytochrome), electron transfer subunit
MKTLGYSVLLLAGACLSGAVALAEGRTWADDEIGLAASVFDTPDPVSFDYIATDPEEADTTLPKAFEDAPPAIPHSIADSSMITLKSNKCLKCHDDQDLWGKEKDADEPSAMPESHYVDFRRDPGAVKPKVIGSRYFCLQCHVPQAEVDLLVENSF